MNVQVGVLNPGLALPKIRQQAEFVKLGDGRFNTEAGTPREEGVDIGRVGGIEKCPVIRLNLARDAQRVFLVLGAEEKTVVPAGQKWDPLARG